MSWKMLVIFCPAWLVMGCCPPLWAQQFDVRQPIEPPQTIELPMLIRDFQEPVVHVPDGGRMIFGGGIKSPQLNIELMPVPTMENGSQVYRFSVDGKPWQITINDDDSIDVTWPMKFTIDELDKLRRWHWDIAARMEELPVKSLQGEDVQWQLEITTSISVMHAGQLRRLYPQLYEVYKQYIHQPAEE